MLATLNSDRFADKAPRQVIAELLDEDRYLCSVRTMYRVLEAAGELRERRDQLCDRAYVNPKLLALRERFRGWRGPRSTSWRRRPAS